MIRTHGSYPYDMRGVRRMGTLSVVQAIHRIETSASADLLKEHSSKNGGIDPEDKNWFLNKCFVCIETDQDINDVATAIYNHDGRFDLISIPIEELKKKAEHNKGLNEWLVKNYEDEPLPNTSKHGLGLER